MMEFPFGKSFIELEIPRKNLVSIVVSRDITSDIEEEEVKRAIDSPIGRNLEKSIERGSKVVIIVSDISRPSPSRIIVSLLLETLGEGGIRTEDVEIVVANGLHRPSSQVELEELLGRNVLEKVTVINHSAYDNGKLKKIGKTSFGTDIIINKRVAEADFIIGTGVIEPHLFAGYSGGRKSILPGVAGYKSIMQNHSFKMINHKKARYGVLQGNPIHEDMIEAAKMTKRHSILNVVFNRQRKIAKAFSGDWMEAHEVGVRFLESMIKIPVLKKTDIVVTTNGGYPMDRNLYQAVKGIATGELVVKRGGIIIIFAECIDGIEHESFYKLAEGTKKADDLLKRIRENEPIADQWEAQILARILKKAEVVVVTKGVKDSLIEDMLMTPASTPEEALSYALKKAGKRPKITAIPEGPLIIPYISSEASNNLKKLVAHVS